MNTTTAYSLIFYVYHVSLLLLMQITKTSTIIGEKNSYRENIFK